MEGTLRTFRGPDTRSALAAVKAALGPDAIIVSTRDIGGGLMRRSEVEVTAGLPSWTPDEPPSSPSSTRVQSVGRPAFLANQAPAALAGASMGELQKLVEETRDVLRAAALQAGRTPLPGRAAAIWERLVERGLEEKLADELVRFAMEDAATPGSLSLETAVRAALSDRLVAARAPWLPGPRRVIALVGPTGVGKTTTAAKIAAKAVLEGGQRVALLTIDTYRIGGADHLRRYGDILGVPVGVARNGEELQGLLARSSADLVLVDTAGRSTNEAISTQGAMLAAIPGLQTYLVASAAGGPRDLARVADRFAGLKPSRLIFTKLDEAATPGSILAATCRIRRPVACITDGQRVPEDLHAVEPDKLVDLVLGPANPGAESVSARSDRGSGR